MHNRYQNRDLPPPPQPLRQRHDSCSSDESIPRRPLSISPIQPAESAQQKPSPQQQQQQRQQSHKASHRATQLERRNHDQPQPQQYQANLQPQYVLYQYQQPYHPVALADGGGGYPQPCVVVPPVPGRPLGSSTGLRQSAAPAAAVAAAAGQRGGGNRHHQHQQLLQMAAGAGDPSYEYAGPAEQQAAPVKKKSSASKRLGPGDPASTGARVRKEAGTRRVKDPGDNGAPAVALEADAAAAAASPEVCRLLRRQDQHMRDLQAQLSRLLQEQESSRRRYEELLLSSTAARNRSPATVTVGTNTATAEKRDAATSTDDAKPPDNSVDPNAKADLWNNAKPRGPAVPEGGAFGVVGNGGGRCDCTHCRLESLPPPTALGDVREQQQRMAATEPAAVQTDSAESSTQKKYFKNLLNTIEEMLLRQQQQQQLQSSGALAVNGLVRHNGGGGVGGFGLSEGAFNGESVGAMAAPSALFGNDYCDDLSLLAQKYAAVDTTTSGTAAQTANGTMYGGPTYLTLDTRNYLMRHQLLNGAASIYHQRQQQQQQTITTTTIVSETVRTLLKSDKLMRLPAGEDDDNEEEEQHSPSVGGLRQQQRHQEESEQQYSLLSCRPLLADLPPKQSHMLTLASSPPGTPQSRSASGSGGARGSAGRDREGKDSCDDGLF